VSGKHFAPEPERRVRLPALPSPLRVGALVALLVGAVLLGSVIVTSIVEKRSPADLFGGLFMEAPQQHFHKDRIALLMVGIDYNYDEKGMPYSANARTDTIMTLSVNFPTRDNPRGSVGILSVPRDMDYTFPNGHEDKINVAYALGTNPLDASHRAERAVADFLGIPKFDRFITLRINAAKELIDAIGGIDVKPDETMDYDDHWGHLSIHFKGGKLYHMNGEQAVSYSRFRHDACGDPCRIGRQQQVMRIALKKLEDEKFSDILRINQLIAIIRSNVVTDISDREAISIAYAMRNVDLKALKTEQVPFVGDKDLRCCGNVIIADDAKKSTLVHKLFLDSILPAASPDARSVAALAPATIHVNVRNGSGISGAAHRLAEDLKKQGFAIERVGDAPTTNHLATEVHVSETSALAGHRVLQAIPLKSAVIVSDPTAPGTPARSSVTIVVGRDYSAPQREASAVK
jgi:LCP family protein required for cell wall assembly